ncbi:MAG TPA: response regulator [Burkholderiales bacterium]|jgi:Response regulators consisting of a CheY-like receiver domain and a winged-helix DNA-binding domain
MRVLLVEDNKDMLTTTAAILRFEKYEVVTALDGHVALEVAKLEPPDVVLLDIGLPKMDGYKLAQALRQLATGRKLYIGAITGYGTDSDKKRAAESGIDAHLVKPVHPLAIIQLLADFVSRLQKD